MSSRIKQENSSQNRILVVDDELDVNISLHMVLETNGFRVDSYSDPREVLQNFRPGVYGLIILDIKMPHLNGLALYRELKKIDHDAKICFFYLLLLIQETYKNYLRLLWQCIEQLGCLVPPTKAGYSPLEIA